MDLQFFPAWVLHGRQVAEGASLGLGRRRRRGVGPGQPGPGDWLLLCTPGTCTDASTRTRLGGGAWQGVGGTVCIWVGPCDRWAGLTCRPLEAEPESFAETFLRAKP